VIFLLTNLALGAGFEVAQQSAAAGGTGHASVARTDAAAAWNNPAALTDGDGFKVAVGASLAMARIEAASTSETDDWYAQTEPGVSTPPYLYLSYSNGPWSTGLSTNAAFAGGVEWPADWPGRFDIISSAPRFFRVAPYFAYRIGPVSFSAGPHADVGTLGIYKATNHIDSEGQAVILMGGAGFGAHLSAHSAISKHVQLGLAYKSRTRLRLQGDADFDVPDAFMSMYPDQSVSTKWTLPDRLTGGATVSFARFTGLAELSLTTWKLNDELVLSFSDDATDDIVQTNDWRNTVAFRAGTEVEVHQRVVVRAGGYVDGLTGSAAPAQTLSPSSPDSRRIGATLGAGVDIAHGLRADAYGEHLRLLARSSKSPDAIEAAYAGRATVLGLGLSWRASALKKAGPWDAP
jgi:long-chain fatty acid transport protein